MNDSQSHYFWSSFPVYLVIALIFFIGGLLIGWLLWRRCRERAESIHSENQRLRQEYHRLNRSIQEIS